MDQYIKIYRQRLREGFSRIRWLNLMMYAASGVVALIIALVVWHQSLLHLDVPLHLSGDALAVQYAIKTVIDHGWYLVNPDVGAPFVGTMYDFPNPAYMLFVFIRVLGLFSKNPFIIFNLFYLLGFVWVTWSACWAFTRCGVALPLALAGAIAYAILPYHFFRLDHTYLAFYFAAPIFCCYALRLAVGHELASIAPPRLTVGAVAMLMVAAGGGVYYAFFGCLFIAMGAVYGAVRHNDIARLRTGGVYVVVIVTMIVLALLPNFFYHLSHGTNQLVAHRDPAGAEIYGLRITQMLLPAPGNRFAWANALTSNYNQHAPLINENQTATLGILGSLGFLIALAVFIFGNQKKLPALSATGALTVTGVLYATIGGFGALAAFLFMPELRGLNRISVFIAFFGLFALLFMLSMILQRWSRRLLPGMVAIAIVVVACADQIPARQLTTAQQARQRIIDDKTRQQAYDRLQAEIPPGTAIYQLPYVYFPESPNNDEEPYRLFVPYLYTHGLRWSFGAMHGRTADIWNKRVSQLTGRAFSSALASAGFGAVYVDGRGYKDNGAAISQQMITLFGPPIWQFGNEALYRIPPELDAKPYAAVEYGQGWYGLERSGHATTGSTTWNWTRGNATLDVANPAESPAHLIVNFTLASFIPQKVSIRYGNQSLGTYDLGPGTDASVQLNVTANHGASQIELATDTRGKLPGNGDMRRLSFRMINLVTKTR